MDKTPFSKQCQILHDLYLNHSTEYEDFILDNDLGIPLAVLIVQGCATPTDKGMQHVSDSFDSLCEILEIDKYGDYETIETMIGFANE
jgi:hypothetical protein